MTASAEIDSGGVAHLPRFTVATHRDYTLLRARDQQQQRLRHGPAAMRAWETLREFLRPDQEITLCARKIFREFGSSGGEYIFRGEQLWWQPDDLSQSPMYVCFHAPIDNDFPLDDEILTKLLWLQSDEEKFRWYANFQEHPWADAWAKVFAHERIIMFLVMSLVYGIVTRWPDDDDTVLAESKRLGDLCKHHSPLLWRMAQRYLPYLPSDAQQYVESNLDAQLKVVEARYAR